MRTLKTLLAAVLAVVMIMCMGLSTFAAYEDLTYTDVSEMYPTTMENVNIQSVRFVDALGIIPSYKDGSFNPAGTITRGDALKIAYKMLHYNYDEMDVYGIDNTGFDEAEGGDISDVDMLKPYIAWAQDYQLINSLYVPDKKFEANKEITVEEFVILMTKVVGLGERDTNFDDLVLGSGEIDIGGETLNREQAAVIVARAMMYAPDVLGVDDEMFSTFEYDGSRLDCLATRIYGCNSSSLLIRATRQRPMDYEYVTHDMLLSNGVQCDVGVDMSGYVGYQIDVVYLDADGSDTFTEDEELLTYSILSPWINNVTVEQLNIPTYMAMSGSSATSSFSIYGHTMLYLNDNLWPEDESYNLTKLVNFVNFTAAGPIVGRPNLEFTFLQHGASDYADVVFATEWIPGKLMTVTDNYISVFSYYDGKTRVYEDNDVDMTAIVNPAAGDIVNFYEANGRLYLCAGNVAEMTEFSIDSAGILKDAATGTTYNKHLFANKAGFAAVDVTPVNVVLDKTGKTYLTVEPIRASADVLVEVISAVAADDGETAELLVRDLATGAEYELNPRIKDIYSGTGIIDTGSIFTYYYTEAEQIIMNGVDPIETVVIEQDDYFIVSGGEKYLKTAGFTKDYEGSLNGDAVLYVDAFNGVWAAYKN